MFLIDIHMDIFFNSILLATTILFTIVLWTMRHQVKDV